MILTSASKVINTTNVAKYTTVVLSSFGCFLLILSIYSLINPPSKFSKGHFFSDNFLILELMIFISMILLFVFILIIKIQQNSYKESYYLSLKDKAIEKKEQLNSYYNTIEQQNSDMELLKNEIKSISTSQSLAMNSCVDIDVNMQDQINSLQRTLDQSNTIQNCIDAAKDYIEETKNPLDLLLEFGSVASSKISALKVSNSSSLLSSVVKTKSALTNIQFLDSKVSNLNEIIEKFGVYQLSVTELTSKVFQQNSHLIGETNQNDLDWLQQTILAKINSISQDTLDIDSVLSSLKEEIKTHLSWTDETFEEFSEMFKNISNPDVISQINEQLISIKEIIYSKNSPSNLKTSAEFREYFSNTEMTTNKSQFLKLLNLCLQYGVKEDASVFLAEDLKQISNSTQSRGNLISSLQKLFSDNKTNNADLQTITNIYSNIDPNISNSNVQSEFIKWIKNFTDYSLDEISQNVFNISNKNPDNFFRLLYNEIDNTIYNNLRSIDDFSTISNDYSTLLEIENISSSLQDSKFIISRENNNADNLRNISLSASASQFPLFISTLQNSLGGYNSDTPFSSTNILGYINQLHGKITETFGTTVSSFSAQSAFSAQSSYYINKYKYPYTRINSYMNSPSNLLGFDNPASIEDCLHNLEELNNPFIEISRNNLTNLSSLSDNLTASDLIKQIREKINVENCIKENLLTPYLVDQNLPMNINNIKSSLYAILSAKGSAPDNYLVIVAGHLNSIFGISSLFLTENLDKMKETLDDIYKTLGLCGFSNEDPGTFIRSLNYFSDFQNLLQPYALTDSNNAIATVTSDSVDLSTLGNIELNFPSINIDQLQELKNSMISQFNSWYDTNYHVNPNLNEKQFFLVVKNILSYRCFLKTLKEMLYQASLKKFFTFYTDADRMQLSYNTYSNSNLNTSHLNDLITQIDLNVLDPLTFDFNNVMRQVILLINIYKEFGRIYTLGKYLDANTSNLSLSNIANTLLFRNEGLFSDEGDKLKFNRSHNGIYVSANEINNMCSLTSYKSGISILKELNVIRPSSETIKYSYHTTIEPFTEFFFFNSPMISLSSILPFEKYFSNGSETLTDLNFISFFLIDEVS